jgi:hypothetical protein
MVKSQDYKYFPNLNLFRMHLHLEAFKDVSRLKQLFFEVYL